MRRAPFRILTAALCGGLGSLVSAQAAGPQPPAAAAPQDAPRAEWIVFTEYAERTSRAAFAACDGNADDRLSVLEAARSLEGIGTADLEAFRRLDSSADGFIHWPDFDRRFRELTDRGTPLRIRPSRPLPADLTPTKQPVSTKPTGLERAGRVIAENDADGDGLLSIMEAAMVAAKLIPGADPAALATAVAGLDIDGSGDLSATELLTVAERLPLAGEESAALTPAAGPWPPGYRFADENHDGVLDRTELERMLRSLDPSLARWSQQILRNADRSGNDTLGPAEIRQAEKADSKTR